jgi:hypothetical protein
MFQKLNKQFKITGYKSLTEQVTFGNMVDGKFKGIKYLNVDCQDYKSVIEYIPVRYRNMFCVSLMEINTEIPPHTDCDLVTINFYVETDNCVTEFFTFKNSDPKKHRIDNQTGHGFIYNKEDLLINGNYIAEPGDVYILDVTKPHSVIPLNQIKNRVAITLSTATYDYNAVCDMLRETGHL